MDIRPIRSDEDHAEALAEIERLWGTPVGSPEGDKLDVLATLVEAYEEKRWPIEAPDPVEVIRYAISDLGHTQAELADLLGSRPRASEVLNRRRALTVDMVHKISSQWHIPADLLVRPYHLTERA
ncbi:helix-turn-helix domain-containing protein [Aureimonas populi]|uniref:Type II toxin-antitoxin system HigA family antitoxin n=1 Tax=Aureimonas populi TaxID=1701758 RepID=A0ABW5CI96_9HYPH|nr:transcriptional regulator [Aureimonas populi]